MLENIVEAAAVAYEICTGLAVEVGIGLTLLGVAALLMG